MGQTEGAEAPFKRERFERGDVVQYHDRAIVSVQKRVGSVGGGTSNRSSARGTREDWSHRGARR